MTDAGTVRLTDPRAVQLYDLTDPTVREELNERVTRIAEISRKRRLRVAARQHQDIDRSTTPSHV